MSESGIFEERFRLEEIVGRGSFGIVYRAYDRLRKEPVAIKALKPEVRHDETLRQRLRREAKVSGMLKSPHVVRIFERGRTHEGDYFIVMEYLEGEELTEVIHREGKLSPPRVARIACQVLNALDEAHSLNVIHRDLKPHNIFLCRGDEEEDSVKLFDFGIAKLAPIVQGCSVKESIKLTVMGGVLGTPVYMSPEQAIGTELTPASDLYSLGIVLYEALNGRVPFDDRDPIRVLYQHVSEPVPPLPEDIAQSALGRAVFRSLEKEPAARFATAADFLAAIEGREVPGPAAEPTTDPADDAPTPPGSPEPSVEQTALAPSRETTVEQRLTPPPSKPSGNTTWIPFLGAGIALAALLALVLWYLL